LHVVRIEKAGRSRKDIDAVARKLRANHIDFRLDDVQRAEGKIRHGDLFLHAIIYAVNALILIPGKVQDRFADGFAGIVPVLMAVPPITSSFRRARRAFRTLTLGLRRAGLRARNQPR